MRPYLEKILYQNNYKMKYLRCNFYTLGLEKILLLIGTWFSNPFIPDFGVQFGLSTAIGLLLPERIVKPISKSIEKIPGIGKFIQKFEKKLENYEKFKYIVPRIIAGYAITYCIGAGSIIAYYCVKG